VKTIRRTLEGPRVPWSMELEHAFPPEALPDPPTGPSYRQVYAEVITARDERDSATLPQLGRTLQGNGSAPTQEEPSSYDWRSTLP
jgi:hypothetical protein